MPPHGEVRLRVLDDRITLLANAAPRRPLLEVLALRLGFELDAADLGDEPVTVELRRGALEDALPALLADRAYRLDYRYDAAASRHRIARLAVAAPGAQAPSGPGERGAREGPAPSPPSPPRTEPEPELAAGEPPPAPPESEPEVDWKELVARLDDADADERIEALEEIDPDGEGLPLIVDRLARDPDPRVRIVAAEKLELSDSLASVDALVGALGDPDRDVVLAAIDALELTDDDTVTQDLGLLLDHPDAAIRRAAREAIDFIAPEPDEDAP
jgi:hypothetical protein